ncbi:MAG: hypothetical protein AVDCRST_MAG17-932 [uncultured Solirubrobacterales bacterium]|uniref:Uncharacterized protein n=1 Tax=uncultured Solirubrobacterales bacterium TaxID=768556 RepID=A0A6J4S9Y8_9ACTN|nr:MAG: hypothetical protein AVDCRST_MAG17-932 [uncultured Solirubrobacterales bacterium]
MSGELSRAYGRAMETADGVGSCKLSERRRVADGRGPADGVIIGNGEPRERRRSEDREEQR